MEIAYSVDKELASQIKLAAKMMGLSVAQYLTSLVIKDLKTVK